MNRLSKAKLIRRLTADLAIEEAKYEKMSSDILSIDSNSKEWSEFAQNYNLCANKISALSKQIEVLERTGKTLGLSENIDHRVHGTHLADNVLF